MAAPTTPLDPDEDFDPLVDLHGIWTTRLAQRYLPIDGMPAARYECVDGRLFVSPYESAGNSRAGLELALLLGPAAKQVGLRPMMTVNLTFGPERWIQPDLAVLDRDPGGLVWVPTEYFVMPVEIVSPSSRRRDRVDKPAMCAEAGVPFFLDVEVPRSGDSVTVRLSRLANGHHHTVAEAGAGETFTMTEPFPVSFDPARLLGL